MHELLACLYLVLDTEDFDENERIDFVKQWQEPKMIKTIELNKFGLNSFDEGYKDQFKHE